MNQNSILDVSTFLPRSLQFPNAWVGHLPFAAWVIQEVSPKIFVELGTHTGNSYFSFCQSVAEGGLSTKCYAVDTWLGDEHAGQYNDEVFAGVSMHNQEHYAGFSRLLRMKFDEALNYFADGSIGLLHIDGFHTYEAVQHDFETWLPKLEPGAVVLFHDTNVRERDFGVWEFWEELQARYPNNLEFVHSHGLGVLQLNDAPADKEIAWLQPSSSYKQGLISYFAALGSRQLERYDLKEVKNQLSKMHQVAAERDSQITNLKQVIAERDGQITSLKQVIAECDDQSTNLKQVIAERDSQIVNLKQIIDGQIANLKQVIAERDRRIEGLEKTLEQQKQELHSIEEVNKQVNEQLAFVLNGNSFKITRPLRRIRRSIHLAGHTCRLARQYISHRGGIVTGLPILITRSWEILSFGGGKGFISRLKEYSRLSDQRIHRPLVSFERTVYEQNLLNSEQSRKTLSLNQVGLLSLGEVVKIDYRFWKSFKLPCDVDIIICVHNALEDVKRCLTSVVQYSAFHSCRIIIVDDGSRNDTRDYLQVFSNKQGAVLLRNDNARGYTFAANQGLCASSGGYVILLNSDTIVTPGWIEKLVACAESDPRIGLVGPLSNTASWQSIPEIEDNGDWATNSLPEGMTVTDMGDIVAKYSAHIYPKMSFLNGFCMLIRREVIDQLGIFDEEAFGRGYGEENDYCIRALNSGWTLSLADNAYVYHAQSKSYSHEKRKLLADHSGQKLAEKHGYEIIANGVEQCHRDRSLISIRAHARVMFERESTIAKGQVRWQKRRLAFILPVMYAGGGGNVVITEAKAMMRMGVDVTIVNLSANKNAFEKNYPNPELPVIYAKSPEEIVDLVRNFDAVVATANYSVQWIAPLASQSGGPILGYYIQDFEPYFYEPGTPGYELAYRSYSLVPEMRLFTKTQWNRDELFKKTGLQAEVVGPSYDVDLFRPRSQGVISRRESPIRIVAMVRPSSPRRNPEGTITILSLLKERHGNRVDIAIFGSETEDSPIIASANALGFANYGQLRMEQTALLLSNADIFIDMSYFQAMGLTAMEAMACGAVSIVPLAGGASSYAKHNENAIVVNTENLEEVFNVVSELIENTERLRKLQFSALNEIIHYYPEKSAIGILNYLFS